MNFRTLEQAQQYVLDYVAAGCELVRETKDGFVFRLVEAFHYEDGQEIKIFKSLKVREDEYQTMKKRGGSKKVACLQCGNTKKSELEQVTLHSDGEGNDVEEVAHLCQENKGCNSRKKQAEAIRKELAASIEVEAQKIREELAAATVAPLAADEPQATEEQVAAEELQVAQTFDNLAAQEVKPRIEVKNENISGEFHIDGADAYLLQVKGRYVVEGYRGEETYKFITKHFTDAHFDFYKLQIRMMNGEAL